MAKLTGNILFTGTIDNICFYRANGQYYARMASSLTGKRVKKDKAFRRTMENAGVMGRASRIASKVYGALPESFKQFWMFRAFTGEAIQWLRQGKADEEATQILWKTYVEVWVSKELLKAEEAGSKRATRPRGIPVTRRPRKPVVVLPVKSIFDILNNKELMQKSAISQHTTVRNKHPAPS